MVTVSVNVGTASVCPCAPRLYEATGIQGQPQRRMWSGSKAEPASLGCALDCECKIMQQVVNNTALGSAWPARPRASESQAVAEAA